MAIADRRSPVGSRRHGAIRGVLPLEVGVGQLADLDRADDPGAVDEVGLRPGGDPVGGLERLVGIDHGRPGRAVLGHEVAGRLGRVVGQDADDGEPVGARAAAAWPRAAGTRRGTGTHDGPQKLMSDRVAARGRQGRTRRRRGSCPRWPARRSPARGVGSARRLATPTDEP